MSLKAARLLFIWSLLTIVANKQTSQVWANPKILPETNPNTCPDIGRGVQGRRRTQLRRPLELKAGPEQWNVAANYFIWRESYQGPTKYRSKDCCYRRNLFTTNFRNAKLIRIERKSKGWHLLLPEYVSVWLVLDSSTFLMFPHLNQNWEISWRGRVTHCCRERSGVPRDI